MFDQSHSSDRMHSAARFVSHRAFLLILIFLAVAMLFLGRADSQSLNALRNRTAEALVGVFELFTSPVTAVMGALDGAHNMLLVYEDNERLRRENERLMQWKALAEQLQGTVARYNDLLNVALEPGIGFVTGRAVSDSGTAFIRTLIVNVGQKQGVSYGQAVINDRGLVGWIMGAGEDASRVLMVSDFNSRIPVKIGEQGYRAIMIGDNSSKPRLEFLMAIGEVEPGAAVMTSGDEGVLPPGLPVGVIKGRDRLGRYRVSWAAGEGPIDYVRVLNYDFPRDVDVIEEDLPEQLQRDNAAETDPAEAAEPEAPAEAAAP